MRVVRMRLGEEFIELTEYLAPKGRRVPVDSRSNDRWFQHIAIITSDMKNAYALLQQNKVEQVPLGDKSLGFSRGLLAKDPDGHVMALIER